MSTRPLLKPHPVITNGDMSANITSAVTIIQMLSLISYSVSWTGASPVGEIIVEVSDDYALNADGSVKNAGTWSPLPLSATATVTGNSDSGVIDISSMPAYAIRLRYARTSGTGTLTSIITCKVA